MKLNLKTLSFITPLLFSSIILCLHGYLGHFSRYIGDDFCTAYFAHRLGVLRATWFWYLNWSGRYSASVLDAMTGLLGPDAVPVIVPFTIIIWTIVLSAFFLTFLHQLKNRFLVSLALATTSLFTLFLLAPEIRQSLYWGQGMRSVVPPLIMGTIQIVLLNQIQSRAWTKVQLWLWGILSFLWALVAGGFSETYASFQVGALLFALLVTLLLAKFKFSNTSLFLGSGLLGAVSALIIVILAPGNSERQAFFPPAPSITELLTISIKSYLLYMANLINSADKVLAILGLFCLAALIGSQFQHEHEMDSRLLLVIPCLMLGLPFICFPPAVYGTSEPPPNRTLILPTYFFLMGLLAWGAVYGNLLAKEQSLIVSKLLPSLAMITITISASINAVNLYQSKSEFIEYATVWDETDANILKSKQNGATQVLIPAIPNWASLNTPNDNPRFWVNLCMSSYYDVQILAITDYSPSSP
jgi:hypothetical protein